MLKVWFPGTNDTEDHGLGGTQWINDNVVVADNGKLGKCLSFNGSNSRLSTTNFELSNNWSFACWAKDDSSVTNWRLLIMLNTTGSDADTQMSFWLHTGEKRFEVCANGKYVSTVKYVPGQWNHFAATYNGSQILIYLNGVKVYTLADTNEQLARHNLTIGARGTNANGGHEGATSYFYGLVNDLRIWDNQVISPREIKELSKGLVLHYPLAMPGQENIIANTSHEIACTYPASGAKDYYSVKTKSVPNETQYTLSFEARSTVDGDHLRTHFYSPNTTTTCESSQGIIKTASDGNMDFTLTTEWRRYWVVYTQTETTAIKSVICPRLCSPASYPSSQSGTGTVYVRNQKLERGSHPTPWIPNPSDTEYSTLGFNDGIEYDVSGYNRNGTKNGAIETSLDTARYTTCYWFNGNTTYIEADPLPAETKTISIWVKTVWTSSSGYRLAVHDKNTGLAIGWSNTGLITYIGSSNGGLGSFVNPSGIVANQWNHVVVVKTGDTTRDVYINGVKATPVGGNYWSGDLTKLHIGARHYSGNYSAYFNGSLSDFRAYTTALSADDVLELYHTSISLSHNGALLTQGEYIES